ncbi:response regulator transcription factor [Caldalkalibacillus salinus]|uniref:response regulator transcription factor n=1 Tax=Caldalkalibacillus salinus TaxID=2803787 RepID=UPI001F291C76|nr:response regulator transcription factor [Caldalkalibacillus salinus]
MIRVWKIAIIDDDDKVLRGMKKIIPWDLLQCTWVGEAKNGQQGMALINQEEPDIVFTDIYMPKLNGLDMVKHLREEGFDGKFIILSGYNDFEHARQAMKLKVDDYLSKPASMDTIHHVLDNVIAQLEAEQEAKLQLSALREKVLQYEPLVEKEKIKSLLTGTISPEVIRAETMDTHQKLAEAIRFADEKQACEVVESYFEALETHAYHATTGIKIGMEMWTIMSYALYDIGIRMNDMFTDTYDIDTDLTFCTSWAEMAALLKEKIRYICHHQQWDENLKHRQLVEQMIEYIHDHLSENITLQDIANQLYISRNYLGQIFKNVVGESFKNYVTRVRVEKAKKMLQEGQYLIYEVSEKVGFVNPAYFTTIFKKYTGYTPTDLYQKRSLS